jgi:hypothetical protein
MEKQIIAVDFHCKYQKVARLDPPTREIRVLLTIPQSASTLKSLRAFKWGEKTGRPPLRTRWLIRERRSATCVYI